MANSYRFRSRSFRRAHLLHLEIPSKANRILHVILIAMSLFILRVWYLSVIQYEQKVEEAQRPQKKSMIIPATRGTIRDRFNLPLAINTISYQATILYSDLKEIAPIAWKQDLNGKRVKYFKRREYIQHLSQMLGEQLDLDAERIEDLIHSKASLYAQVPFVIKEEISEKEYYRLNMLAKDWPGLHMRIVPKRSYPQRKSAAEIIGYMGAINREQYEKILLEKKSLEAAIQQSEAGEIVDFPGKVTTLEQARVRLKELQEKAYTIHDYVGKAGVEKLYEEELRGFYGKKNYYSDSKGNFLWELRPPLEGQRVLLTISSELQEYAEQLLAQSEELRVVRKSTLGKNKKTLRAQKSPWIKGGAIVAIEPKSGEVLALASFPRFDPNDFISSQRREIQKEKNLRINRWFENERYLKEVWNLQQPFERERFNIHRGGFYEEKQWLSWPCYLRFVLLEKSAIARAMAEVTTLHQAVELQSLVDQLTSLFPGFSLKEIFTFLYPEKNHQDSSFDSFSSFDFTPEETELLTSLKSSFTPYFASLCHNYDKILMVDLCRLSVCHTLFSTDLMEKVGPITIKKHRQLEGALVTLLAAVKQMAQTIYHENNFKQWRAAQGTHFLKQKRLEEQKAKVYAKPYLDYFDQEEKQQFAQFWQTYQWPLLTLFLMGKKAPEQVHQKLQINPALLAYYHYFLPFSAQVQKGVHQNKEWKNAYRIMQKALNGLTATSALQYLHTLRSYDDLTRPLFGSYRGIRNSKNAKEKDLATIFYPLYGYGYGRSHAYRQSTIQGSLFKIVTAYEALMQRHKKMEHGPYTQSELNPLTISDQEFMANRQRFMGYTQEGKPIPQVYKKGRLPRSLAHKNIGRIDLIRALEYSSNPYFSLLAADHLQNPNDLNRAAEAFGFGKRTGIGLPGEIAGKLPDDLEFNQTGLYATAIGQHSLIVTPLQTAFMLSAIANRGQRMKPKIVKLTAGKSALPKSNKIPLLPKFPYQESLSLVGIDFPLFTAAFDSKQKSLIKELPAEVAHTLCMPEQVRKLLLKGLHTCVQRTCQENIYTLQRLYKEYPEAIKELKNLKSQLLGKTSTSESVERLDLDLQEGTNLYTHVWFGCIACQPTDFADGKSQLLFRDEFGEPELVVIVYLRYGGYGKEAAPLAAQVVSKWREIKKKHSMNRVKNEKK